MNAKFWVTKATSIKSKLFSTSDIQSTGEKGHGGAAERAYIDVNWFEEDGAAYPIRVFVFERYGDHHAWIPAGIPFISADTGN